MNFVLPTIFLILLILPGFIFRKAFFESDIGTLEANNFYSSLVWGLFISFITHFFFVSVYNFSCKICFTGSPIIDIGKVFRLVALKEHSTDWEFFPKHYIRTGIYFIVTGGFNFVLGRLSQRWAYNYEWDVKSRFLRYKNPWYYLLTGRVCKFPEYQLQKIIRVSYVEAHIIQQVGDVVFVYSGYVRDFKLKGADLDYLVLHTVKRRVLINPGNNQPLDGDYKQDPYKIHCHLMTFNYSSISNITFTYHPPLSDVIQYKATPSKDGTSFQLQEIKS